MIQIEETIIRQTTLHRISGDFSKCVFGNKLIETSDEFEDLALKKVFLKPFVSLSATFEFQHSINIEYNVLFSLVREIYRGADFVKKAEEIGKHLADVSTHPNINEGDVYVVKYDDIKLNNKFYEGVGVYKFEDKEDFIETSIHNKEMKLKFRKGIGNKKPDKACLVIFTEEPYTILVIDNTSSETEYWQNAFISHQPKNDFVNSTSNFLNLTKSYITSQITNEFEVSRADQIDLLNRSVDYFKTHDEFNKADFEKSVFEDKGVIKSFRKFDEQFKEENNLEILDEFEISSQAVKKQARNFKNVLKLDKNFHIYIHGDRQLIEQGIDDHGRKFYKIYYDEES